MSRRARPKADKRNGRRTSEPIKEVSPARVNRSVTEPLRKVLYFARDTLGQHIRPIKWKQHILKEPAERIRVMKAEQEEAILAALPEKYHPLVYVKKRIGPRIFELLKMKWSDIDWSGPGSRSRARAARATPFRCRRTCATSYGRCRGAASACSPTRTVRR